MNLLDASCRVAFASMIHDLGKFAQRADIPVLKNVKEIHEQLYCPRNYMTGRPTHIHAAYTAIGFDVLEKLVPDLVKGDMFPFAGHNAGAKDVTDSLINAAAKHHAPQTMLQAIVATADRVSSGFERDKSEQIDENKSLNYLRTRLRSLLEQVHLPHNAKVSKTLSRNYRLKPLTAENLFTVDDKLGPKTDEEAKLEYRYLWDDFIEQLKLIPQSHRSNWALWLDHFDTIYQTFTSSIPSATFGGVVPDVSLYDHSKATAAMAVALWRYHYENQILDERNCQQLLDRVDYDQEKFLLIQGDFFGIQNFIFAQGSETNKASAKLLRGRSFSRL